MGTDASEREDSNVAPSDAGGNEDASPPTEDAAPPDCVPNPGTNLDGEAIPLAEIDFLNAFDPGDTTVYDPNAPESLPGPVMADVWGDRSAGAHGTLGVFPPGFVAPIHTHSKSYHGVVVRGEMTNPFGTDLAVLLDDDDTNNHGNVVLGPGSYWFVPDEAQHSTTCVGPEVCWFYFHSEDGFDFAPLVDEMGDLMDGIVLEEPHADAVLLPHDELMFAQAAPFVQFAPAFGAMGPNAHGTFGEFIAGGTSPIHVHGAPYYGIVIHGELTNPFNDEVDPPTLTRGGYWSVPADAVHVTACSDAEPCLFYFHQRQGFDFAPLCSE